MIGIAKARKKTILRQPKSRSKTPAISIEGDSKGPKKRQTVGKEKKPIPITAGEEKRSS